MSNEILTPATVQPKPKKSKKWLLIIGGILALFVIIGIANAGNKDAAPTAPAAVSAPTKAPAAAKQPAAVQPPASTETASQKNAARAAENYIGVMPFSRTGLIKQLEFDKYTAADAAYAADSLKADWNEQAMKKAKSYLDTMPFSHDALIKQLAFDGFTPAQAEFGTTKAGI